MNYQKRFHQLLNYIEKNLDEELTIDKLSAITCLSKYHFHRQFASVIGITAFAYIRQARMKRASYQLAFKKEMRIIDIALANGYESSEAFSRAFKESIGQNPSKFRSEPLWTKWNEKEKEFKKIRALHMKQNRSSYTVNIVDFAEIKVASLEHIGPLELLGNSINEFIKWRIKNNLSPKKSRTFNIIYDDPAVTPAEQYRCEICASIKTAFKENEDGITTKTIPSGRCALIRHIGLDETINEAITYLYSQWLIESEEELRDHPLFFERISFFPDVLESEVITDIYLPLK